MNLSDVMTRIKYKLGIMNIASPVRNIDGMISTIIKDITVPDFSIYNPDRYTLWYPWADLWSPAVYSLPSVQWYR